MVGISKRIKKVAVAAAVEVEAPVEATPAAAPVVERKEEVVGTNDLFNILTAEERLVRIPVERAVLASNHKGTPVVIVYRNGIRVEFYPADGVSFPDELVAGARFNGIVSVRESDGVRKSADGRFYTAFFVGIEVAS